MIVDIVCIVSHAANRTDATTLTSHEIGTMEMSIYYIVDKIEIQRETVVGSALQWAWTWMGPGQSQMMVRYPQLIL